MQLASLLCVALKNIIQEINLTVLLHFSNCHLQACEETKGVPVKMQLPDNATIKHTVP